MVKSIAQALEQRNNPPPNPNDDLAKSIAQQMELLKQLISGLPTREVHYGTIAPGNPQHGDLWYHSGENRLYAYVEE